ncbi:Sec-independent protein translocase protein TatB [Helicobacter anatolicus]|uniref:Sec-independent protein translocase protein TatB n=1 Tax=Helicobacter anatolicus TaxID=2905874 RepID=UPI0022B8F6E3|nr:Sec-independent protein translocase protein TatB [Helicobacter anatolicus]
MFGFNIFEILVILVVAIIFLGPDKLPQLIVDIVKFFKMIKKNINDAKETFDKELQISEIKKEALEYKAQFENTFDKVTKEIQLQDINEMFKEYKEEVQENITEIAQNIQKNETQEKNTETNSSIVSQDEKKEQTQKDTKESDRKKNNTTPNIGKKTSFKPIKEGENV